MWHLQLSSVAARPNMRAAGGLLLPDADLVVLQVHHLDDAVHVQELGEGAHATVRDLVVSEVDAHNAEIVHEARGKHAHFVVIEHVGREVEGDESLTILKAARQGAAVGELHAKDGSVVVHANVTHAVVEGQVVEGAASSKGEGQDIEMAALVCCLLCVFR
jgi:hypothetical protein